MPISPEEKSQLLQAKTLLQQKRYAEARVILEGLPFNDTAFQWLTKLNEIAPPPPPAAPIDDLGDPFEGIPFPNNTNPTIPVLPPKKVNKNLYRHHHEPKPHYNRFQRRLMAYAVIFAGVLVVFGVATVLNGAGIIDLDYETMTPYTGPYLSLEYSSTWEEPTTNVIDSCPAEADNCFLFLETQYGNNGFIQFFYTATANVPNYLKQVLTNLNGDSSIRFERQATMLVANRTATIYHYTSTNLVGTSFYYTTLYFPAHSGVIVAEYWSSNQTTHESMMDEFYEIIGTIQVTGDGV